MGSSPSLSEAKAEIPDRSLEAETEAKTMEECLLQACFWLTLHHLSYTAQAHLPSGTTHGGLVPRHQLIIQKVPSSPRRAHKAI